MIGSHGRGWVCPRTLSTPEVSVIIEIDVSSKVIWLKRLRQRTSFGASSCRRTRIFACFAFCKITQKCHSVSWLRWSALVSVEYVTC